MSEEVIRLEGVCKDFVVGDTIVHALHNISLTINKNEYVALMGPSGSGKSTLMNILGCLDTPTSGHYFLNGTDTSNMDDNKLAYVRNKEIGFVFQNFNLLSRSNAIDNVMLPQIYAGIPKKIRLDNAQAALEKVGLSKRLYHKPNELSGGQRQRVAIARALINNPAVILADEPTGALDSHTSIDIMHLLDDIHDDGGTILLVTHEESIAMFAHRIIRLKDGAVISDMKNTR